MRYVYSLLCVLAFNLTLSAQTTVVITTGPITSGDKLAWWMGDGTTAAAAQAYEVRVRVDGATTPLVIPGVTCAANVLTDASNGAWSLGAGATPNIQVLRNGTPVTNAFGVKLSLVNNVIYMLGDDTFWYKWTGSTFTVITASDPAITVLDAAAVYRWSCQAPVTSALIRLLNARGSHSMVLRLFDTVNRIESLDSPPSALTTPLAVTQPITVRIIR
jgi:hypothetical protein